MGEGTCPSRVGILEGLSWGRACTLCRECGAGPADQRGGSVRVGMFGTVPHTKTSGKRMIHAFSGCFKLKMCL